MKQRQKLLQELRRFTQRISKKSRAILTIIIAFEEFKTAEKAHLTGGEPEEITAECFNEMFNILPPLKWCTLDGVEMFCISEMYTETYTNQYAYDKKSGKYYTKMVDICDKSTWINNYLKN